jgi:hypothetical protein
VRDIFVASLRTALGAGARGVWRTFAHNLVLNRLKCVLGLPALLLTVILPNALPSRPSCLTNCDTLHRIIFCFVAYSGHLFAPFVDSPEGDNEWMVGPAVCLRL